MATPQITRIRPVRRQDGIQVPRLVSPAEWIDTFVLAQNVVETYTLPTDADGNRATILRFSTSNTNLFVKWDGVASVPGDVNDGTASICVPATSVRKFLAAPNAAYTLSLISSNAAGNTVTIEAWS